MTKGTHPTNYHPSISKDDMQKLNAASPDRFRHLLYSKFNPRQRHLLMRDEKQRRKTFDGIWPHESNISVCVVKMSKAGFYFGRRGDIVTCAFCYIELDTWASRDCPRAYDSTRSPDCEFIRGLECGNVAYEKSRVTKEDLGLITIYKTKYPRSDNSEIPEWLINGIGIQATPKRPESEDNFGIWGNRHDSFLDNVVNIALRNLAKKLADAGFFLNPLEGPEKATCFSCQVVVSEWKPHDIPWEEHAKWSPECSFLVNEKGKDFIREVRSRETNTCRQTPDKTSRIQDEAILDNKDVFAAKLSQTCKCLGYTLSQDTVRQAIDAIETNDRVAKLTSVLLPEVVSKLGQNSTDCKSSKCTDQAIFVGLPCGHLLYCEKCKLKFDEAKTHPEVCFKCGSALLADNKTYML